MNQSDMANSTGQQENVIPLPQLEKGPNGWSGKFKHFRVSENVIRIKNTDADISHIPSAGQRQWSEDEEGNFSVYEEITESDNHLYQLWMNKVGPYLADWVLHKSPHGAFFFPCSFLQHVLIDGEHLTASPPWKLLKFPENYTLWVHKKGFDTDPANPRIDAYLHGAPRLGPATPRSPQLSPTVFRSPMEFVEHAIWLMKGGDDSGQQCRCKYCEPDQSQTEINDRLNHGVIVIDDDDDDHDPESGDGAGSGGVRTTTNNSASSASRRGRGGARRVRRAKRDRSPPIMAKDYRVGIPGADPGPGPAT